MTKKQCFTPFCGKSDSKVKRSPTPRGNPSHVCACIGGKPLKPKAGVSVAELEKAALRNHELKFGKL